MKFAGEQMELESSILSDVVQTLPHILSYLFLALSL